MFARLSVSRPVGGSPSGPGRRGRRLVVGLLAVAVVGLASCSGITRPAMTVNGATYSQDALKAKLGVVAGLGAATKPGTKNPGAKKATPKSFTSEQTAGVLTNELYGRIIHELFVQKKVAVPTNAPQKIALSAANSYGDEAKFKTLPKTVQDEALGRAGEIEALQQKAAGGVKPRQYFDAHKDDFTDTCVSHLLVKTEAEARAARARIDKGETFDVVAKAVSTDTGSAKQGGSLGCGNVSQFVPEFAAAAKALKLEEISQPVQTQFGFHILKVTKRTLVPFDAKQQQLAQKKIEDEAGLKLGNELTTLLKAAKVTVNPAFGTYVADGGRGLPEIKPAGFAARAAPATPPGAASSH